MAVYIADAALQAFSNNSMQFCAYDAVESLVRQGKERRTEVISVRNFSLNAGRVAGMLLFLYLPGGENEIWPMVLLNAIAVFSALFVRNAQRGKNRETAQP
jgi:hypothetical protein